MFPHPSPQLVPVELKLPTLARTYVDGPHEWAEQVLKTTHDRPGSQVEQWTSMAVVLDVIYDILTLTGRKAASWTKLQAVPIAIESKPQGSIPLCRNTICGLGFSLLRFRRSYL